MSTQSIGITAHLLPDLQEKLRAELQENERLREETIRKFTAAIPLRADVEQMPIRRVFDLKREPTP